jgi:hypothetical protein
MALGRSPLRLVTRCLSLNSAYIFSARYAFGTQSSIGAADRSLGMTR